MPRKPQSADERGPIERSLAGLRPNGDATPEELALFELALNHATALDKGAGVIQASVGRELRATLEQMRALREARQSDDSDSVDDFLESLRP